MVAPSPRETFSRRLISEGSSMLLGLHLEWMLDTAAFLGNPPCVLSSACHICLLTLTVTAAEQTSSLWLPIPSRVSLAKNNKTTTTTMITLKLSQFHLWIVFWVGEGDCLSEKFSIFYK